MENKKLKEEVVHYRSKTTNFYFKNIKFYAYNDIVYIKFYFIIYKYLFKSRYITRTMKRKNC